jgi:hypothetical protein
VVDFESGFICKKLSTHKIILPLTSNFLSPDTKCKIRPSLTTAKIGLKTLNIPFANKKSLTEALEGGFDAVPFGYHFLFFKIKVLQNIKFLSLY